MDIFDNDYDLLDDPEDYENDPDDYDDEEDYDDEGDYDDCSDFSGLDTDLDDLPEVIFANPGGNSALRAASRTNPRNLPCPSCHQENRLTPKDVQCGYQCDECADQDESGY